MFKLGSFKILVGPCGLLQQVRLNDNFVGPSPQMGVDNEDHTHTLCPCLRQGWPDTHHSAVTTRQHREVKAQRTSTHPGVGLTTVSVPSCRFK